MNTITKQEEWKRCGLPVVERCKREILEDIASGRVPKTVSTFSELHATVDANEYGGACEVDEDGNGGFDGSDEATDFWNRVQEETHQWLVAGRPSGLTTEQETTLAVALAPISGLIGKRRLLDVLYGPDAKKIRRDIVAIACNDPQVRISDKRVQWGNFRELLLSLASVIESCKALEDQQFELIVRCIFLREKSC